jgi:hypothetical protein
MPPEKGAWGARQPEENLPASLFLMQRNVLPICLSCCPVVLLFPSFQVPLGWFLSFLSRTYRRRSLLFVIQFLSFYSHS